MTREEILKKLQDFKELLTTWQMLEYDSPNKSTLRTQINKNKDFVQKVVNTAGKLKLKDFILHPGIDGNVLRNLNPFDVICDPPYRFNPISPILDSIDETIGIIETNDEFSIEPKIKSKEKENGKIRNAKKVFLVHGHNNEIKETVARFLEKIDLYPIILNEQPNNGHTIIEKFEEYSDVSYAIVLMTPDDVGNSIINKENLNFRARQNVIFELGYFLGKLGRKNVCAILNDDLECPSDYEGIIYIGFDKNDGWKMLLVKEMKQVGLEFDVDKIF